MNKLGKTSALVNAIVVCMDENRTILNPGHVVFKDNVIIEITDQMEDLKSYDIDERIDVKNKVVFPGLINTHMHMRPARGFGDGLTTPEWHVKYVDKISELMLPKDCYFGAKLSYAELIRGGTTTILGMTIHGEQEYEAAEDMGIRARFVPHAETTAHLDKHIEKIFSQKGTESDLVRNWLGIEVTSIFSVEQLREIRKCANKTGNRIHTHFSEWERESLNPLLESELLGNDLILAHCVHLNDHEIQQLAKHGVFVAHNPKSNMRLGSGIAPIIKMKEANITVSLGTDGPLSTYKLDMWEEIRTAALLQRVFNVQSLNSWEVLEMATINGAKAMGMESSIGSLEVGKKADMIVIDMEQLHTTPLVVDGLHQNIAPLLVFAVSQTDIETVVVDGKFVMKNKEITNVDIPELIGKVNEIGKRIMSQL